MIAMNHTFRVFDHSTEPLTSDALLPFAFEELLCRAVGNGEKPSIHFWRHEHACILGMRDRQLPYAGDGIAALQTRGYQVAVRHSGGAAVPLDHGVLNFSIVLPMRSGQISFQEDFERMAQVIAQAASTFANLPSVVVGEIAGSYCPGGFDLSVDGRKFAGIAQRRQTKAHIVHAFILVSGDATARAQDARDYYDIAGKDSLTAYPQVDPKTMVSLVEYDSAVTVEGFKQALLGAFSIEETQTSWLYEAPQLKQMQDTLQQRYDTNET
jgi:octanoyl-[GcvH]:protein N-octanoyltransferase